uniref:Uncharacterized protein n=1 Tax=Anopheles dirus TaxID=7168 RepID=A0A182NY06_9DIPT
MPFFIAPSSWPVQVAVLRDAVDDDDDADAADDDDADDATEPFLMKTAVSLNAHRHSSKRPIVSSTLLRRVVPCDK